MLRALAAFEMHVQLRRSPFRIALLLLTLAPLGGLLFQHGRYATALFGYAYLASLALRLTIGMAEDQQSGHGLLMSNFASVTQRLGAKLAGLLVRELVIFLVALLSAALAWGNFLTGLWFTVEFTLLMCLLLPIAAAAELLAGIRAPGAMAILVAGVLVLVGMQNSDPIAVLTWLGIPQSSGSFAALRRLSVHGLAGVAIMLFICWLWALARREMRA